MALEVLDSGMGPAHDPPRDDDEEARVTNDFLFEWFQNFHNGHHLLKSIYKFNKNDCLYNLRYLAMMMHLAVPGEFESIVELDEASPDEMQE